MSILLKIVRFLNFGWAEFLLAMSPVLSTYSRGIIHLDMFSCIIVAMICFFRRQEKWAPGYYKFFVAFVICHELVLCYTMPSLEMYHINNLINMSVFLFTIMIVSPAIDFVKFTHATYFVAIILGIGILYQFRMLLSGNIISPLPVPVIDWFFDRDRGDNLSI